MNGSHLIAHVLVHHQQTQRVLDALQAVPPAQALQVTIAVSQQDVQGVLLGKVAKLLAVG